MERPLMEVDSVTSGIKRRVKDRISKTKLNVCLASKIKTKILNNSSIFKISLKHNNRALARALSREKENSRLIATEKMLLQKEVEKLNFENTFLRLKLNNLNKKLIEIESLVNSNLITAIEMSSLSEFHQSSILSSNKRKRISKQCKSVHLPFARVPLTSENDDDDDDGGGGGGIDDKWKTKCDSTIIAKTPPDVTSEVSRQPLHLRQCNLEEVLLPKENNQNTCGSSHSEHISAVDELPKENHCHSNQSPKSFLVSEMEIALPASLKREKSSLNNVTERKKREFSTADILYVTDLDHQQISNPGLNRNNDINDDSNETNGKMQGHAQCFPDSPSESARDPTAKSKEKVQTTNDLQLQKTVCEEADMDLTAGEVSKIITVLKSNKNQSKRKTDCGKETFRKVKVSSSDKKRERSKKKCGLEVGAEKRIESRPERGDDRGDSEDPNYVSSAEQLPQANMLKKIALQSNSDQENLQNKKRKQTHTSDEQEETYPSSQCSAKFLQDSQFDLCQNTLHCNIRKPSRQTFVIHKSGKDTLFPSQNTEDIISENLEIANEFHIADHSVKENENVCDYETQTVLDLKKCVTVQQNQSKINKPKQKMNRRTKIISGMNQIYEDNDKDIHVLEKDNFPLQTQANKETTYGNLEVSKEFETPQLFTRDNGNLHDYKNANVLDLHKQITSMHPFQDKSQISKNPRQKVNRKTEIISGVNCFSNDRGVHFSEKDESFLLQRDKDIPGTLKDLSECEIPDLCNKDSAKLCDCKTPTLLALKKYDHDAQPPCHKDLKVDKKLKQKVHQKTEIISKVNQVDGNDGGSVHDPLNTKLCQKAEVTSQMNQIHENSNEDVNGFKRYIKDHDFKTNKSKFEFQDVRSCYYGEINNNKKVNGDPVADPCILVKKQRKKSGKAKNVLTGEKSKYILQFTDSSQMSVTLESGLKLDTDEADPGPREQTNLPKNQKHGTVCTLEDAFSVGVVKEGSCPAKRINKLTSKSKKRKTPLGLSSNTNGAVEITPNTNHTKSVDSEQADKENYLESEKIAKSKPDFCTKVLKPLSQICSPNIKTSSLGTMHESSVPLSISSSKDLVMEEDSSLESTCIFQGGENAHEKIKGTRKSGRRTQKSGIGSRTFQDLVGTSSVSSNAPNSGSESEPTRRKRQCAPLNLKEPSLVRLLTSLHPQYSSMNSPQKETDH